MRAIFKARFNLSRWARLLLLAITVMGAGLRFYQLGSKGLWLDEAFSVWLGWQTIPELLEWLLKVDQHPPLYYTLLHFWMGLAGSGAASVRAFSALCGTLTIPVVYLIGKRLAGTEVGLLAAFILALSPFHVRFAQETRMYTLLTLNASLALLALVRLLGDPRSASMPIGRQLARFFGAWRSARLAETRQADETGVGYRRDFRRDLAWVSAPTRQRWLPLQAIETDLAWLALMIFTTAAMLSHNTAVLFPLAVNVFVFGFILYRRWRPTTAGQVAPPSLSNWLLSQAGVFLLWSPWLAAFIVQATGVYGEFWIPAPTWGTVKQAIFSFLSDFLPGQIGWAQLIWSGFGLVAILGAIHLRRRPAYLALLLVLFLAPFAGELLVSLRRPIFYDRTLIWTSIPLYLLLAAGLNQLRYRPYILVSLAMLATINGLSLREYYRNFEKEQWDRAAAYVAQNVENEDVILFNATWVQIPFDYYFRSYNRPVAEHGLPVDLFDRGILEPKMDHSDLPRLRTLIRGRERVWLVYSHNWYTDPKNLIPPALGEELKLLDRRNYYGLELHLYGAP